MGGRRLKHIVISADGDRMVYAVPDAVANHLEAYGLEFRTTWLENSPHAEKYRINGVLCYRESDFIDYLNEWIFPDEPSYFVETLGWIDFGDPLPKKYRDCPEFNF